MDVDLDLSLDPRTAPTTRPPSHRRPPVPWRLTTPGPLPLERTMVELLEEQRAPKRASSPDDAPS